MTTGVVIASVTMPRPNLSPAQTKGNITEWLTPKINNKQDACKKKGLTNMPNSFHYKKKMHFETDKREKRNFLFWMIYFINNTDWPRLYTTGQPVFLFWPWFRPASWALQKSIRRGGVNQKWTHELQIKAHKTKKIQEFQPR